MLTYITLFRFIVSVLLSTNCCLFAYSYYLKNTLLLVLVHWLDYLASHVEFFLTLHGPGVDPKT